MASRALTQTEAALAADACWLLRDRAKLRVSLGLDRVEDDPALLMARALGEADEKWPATARLIEEFGVGEVCS